MKTGADKRSFEIPKERFLIFLRRSLSFFHKIRHSILARYYYLKLKISGLFRDKKLKDPENRSKPHVLMVTEKWFECNPEKGRSNTEHNLIGSLDTSGLASQEIFHYDEYYVNNRRRSDAELIRLCMEKKPDLLFFSPACRFDPRWQTLGLIRKKLGIPVAAIWWDYLPVAETIIPYVDLNIVLQSVYLKETKHPEKYMLMWVPQDQKIYYNPEIERDIEISFTGDKARIDRQKGISALLSSGVNLYQSGGLNERRLSVDEYAGVHMRSKIVLNFSSGGFWSDDPRFRIHQAKGRIFEATLCGAMLLESENPETSLWFEPMVDYVPFEDEKDLVEKAEYYLEHDEEREKIAASGCRKATESYTSEKFWRSVLEKLVVDGLKKE